MKNIRDGYKMTELGEIPSEWEIEKLSNVSDLIDGDRSSRYPGDKDIVKKGILFLNTQNIENSKLVYNNSKFITQEKFNSLSKGKLQKNDLVITLRGSIGNVAKFDGDLYDTGFINAQLMIVRSNNINPNYLHKYLISVNSQKQIKNISSGSAQPQLTKGELKELKIIIPTIKEQEKIASILSTVDEQIDNVDALIEKNKELKKGLMQTLLTKGIGHTKYKNTEIGEIPEEWEVKILDEISANYKNSIVDGPFGSNLKTSDYVEDGVLVMQSSYITGGKFELRDTRYISKEKALELDRSKVKSGDILMAKIGANFGATEIIPQEISYGILSSNSLKIDLDNKIASNIFYLYVLKYYKKFGIIDKLASTTAQPALSLRSIKELKVVFPNIQEQEKIASILLEVDKKIEEYENIRQNLEKLKKGLMQQLLTGKIRVVL